MRQVGSLAAAGLFALKNNIERLAEDHEKAKILAEFIAGTDEFEIDLNNVQTNILMFKPKRFTVEQVLEKCESNGLKISVGQVGYLRAVTHMDVSIEEIKMACTIINRVIK
jgi:threonine aldolase